VSRGGRMLGWFIAAMALVLPGQDARCWTDPPQGASSVDLPLPIPADDAKELGGPLVPGQVVVPIDLAGAIRLAGARDLDIAIARQLVCRSVADLQQARALWLPSLFLGPTWYRMDGKVQTISGQVINADRSSLFVGGLATGANSYPANPPGTGFPPLTGLASVLRFSDAIFLPRAARRELAASQADVRTATNNALLAACEGYFDLLLASGLLAIDREAAANAGELAQITGSYAKTGAGLEADHQRILTELNRRRGDIENAVGRLEVASTQLVQLLVLDPNQVLAPIEPAESVFRLLADQTLLDEMIVQGLHQRPELASSQELVQATLMRLKQARLRPLIPSLAFSYAGGGFGGGQNGFFGNFGTRGDATVSLYWEVQNLGFTDLAIARRSLAENRAATLRLVKVENQVAADVAAAYKTRIAAARRMTQTAPEVKKALESLRLNMLNIRRGAGLPGATRPIEVLQPIQALAQARADYLTAVLDYNRAQFRLYRAIGWPPLPVGPLAAAPSAGSRSASPAARSLGH
jgi:outer membrane protein TolC